MLAIYALLDHGCYRQDRFAPCLASKSPSESLARRYLDERVDAFSFSLGHDGQPFVKVWRHTQAEFARVITARFYVLFLPHLQENWSDSLDTSRQAATSIR